MRRPLFTFGVSLALATGACSKASNDCDQLEATIAKTASVPATTAASWLDKQLTGPSGTALAGEERAATCKMFLGDRDALEGITVAAKTDLVTR